MSERNTPGRKIADDGARWIWVLDREFMELQNDGDPLPKPRFMKTEDKPFPPWILVKVSRMLHLFWWRLTPGRQAMDMMGGEWLCHVEEDKDKHDKVFWWHPHPHITNTMRREDRKRGREEASTGDEYRCKKARLEEEAVEVTKDQSSQTSTSQEERRTWIEGP